MVNLCSGKAPGDWLFPDPDGGPLQYHHLKYVWAKYGPGIPFKDATRRTRATELRNAGLPLEKIQDVLGHANLATTKLYLDEHKEYLTSEIDEIDERINGQSLISLSGEKHE